MIDNIYSVVLFIEFREERRILLEVIGPELQSIYDDRQIEVISFILLFDALDNTNFILYNF